MAALTEKKKVSDLYSTPQVIKSGMVSTSPTKTITTYDGGGSSGGGTGAGASSSPTPDVDPSAVYMDEIQKATHDKNYKTLLQSDIAAYNLKMNSQKLLNNSLAAQGVGTQGYGTSAHVGVENNASQLYAQDQETYNAAETQAAEDAQTRADTKATQAKADATESDNQLVTFLQYSDGSDDSVASYMDKYGYVKGDDGYWYKKGADGTADKTQPASNYVQAAIQSAQDNASKSSTVKTDYSSDEASTSQISAGADSFVKTYTTSYAGVDKSGYASVDALRDAVVGNKDNTSTDKLRNIVGNELNYLSNEISSGNVKEGTLFKLQRGSGMGEAYLVIYHNGRLYICSDDDREQDENQVNTRYNAYQGPKETIKGK
jgi:hypothetical protein